MTESDVAPNEMEGATAVEELAVTEARLASRTAPSTPRIYSFLQLHIDNIVLIHPSAQSLMRDTDYSKEEALRFDTFRSKLNSVLPG